MRHGDLTYLDIPHTGGEAMMLATGVEWEAEADIGPLRGRANKMNRMGGGFHPPMQALAPYAGAYVFTIVRNPFDWLIDVWRFMQPNQPFKEWLFGEGLMLPLQSDWICNMDVTVFKNEDSSDLEAMLSEVLKRPIVIPEVEEKIPSHLYYNNEMCSLVEAAFRKDFKGFKYASDCS